MLLVNADHYTAWNIRKHLLRTGHAYEADWNLKAEMRLLNLIFSKHPKSGEAWSHRRWVLNQLPGFESDQALKGSSIHKDAVFQQVCRREHFLGRG